MHIVIMGCGRVGSALAEMLDSRGHSVAIIDHEATSFRRLAAGFGGRTVTGVGFDREVLMEAGIEQASAFAAVSNGDNSNILAARVARENFGVENVVARIYDPRRAEVYERLGISTVATVRWTTDQMMRRLTPHGIAHEWTDATGNVSLAEVRVDKAWIAEPYTRLEALTGARVAFVTRMGEGMLPSHELVVQEGDQVHVLALETELSRVQDVLDDPPQPQED